MSKRVLPILLLTFLGIPVAHAGGGPENVLVIVNDKCPDSWKIATSYIYKRDVPRHHVVHVAIPTGKDPWQPMEALPGGYDGFQTMLLDPVKRWLHAHPEARITTILLTRGIPVVTAVKNNNELARGTAHMLSILAVEDDDLRTATSDRDFKSNPIHGTDASVDPRDPENETPIYCVGILDAYDLETIDGMIDKSIESDGKEPEGTVYLGKSANGDPRGQYNGAFPDLAEWIRGRGIGAEIIEHPGKNSLLEQRKDILYYAFGQAGWDRKFPATNTYLPGAVIDNLTSVALTWRAFDRKHQGGQTPMTLFLEAGATVVHGCVREPYTGAWDSGYLHIRRYLEGYNVLESFYMGHPWLPWMNLVAGDPLTQPFAIRPEVALESFEKEKGKHVLKVKAKARREETGIHVLRLYVDGVLREEVSGDAGVFELDDFDPDVNTYRVVAIDDSTCRTQGFLSSGHIPRKVTKVKRPSFKGGKIRISANRPAVYTWACSTAKGRTGIGKGRTIALDFEGDGPHVVDVWIRNAKGLAAFSLELPPRRSR